MHFKALKVLFYITLALTIFIFDHQSGNGVATLKMLICKFVCMVKKVVKEDRNYLDSVGMDGFLNVSVLAVEVLVVTISMMILQLLNRYNRVKGRVDVSLKESQDAIALTNQFLDKWRLRKINWKLPPEYSYLDEEPPDIKPLLLSAIADSLSSRNQQEQNAKIVKNSSSIVLRVMDEDFDHFTEASDEFNRKADLNKNTLLNVKNESFGF